MIPVGRLAPGNQWDQAMIEDLLSGKLWRTGIQFTHHEGYPSRTDGCVLLIPGRYWAGHEDEISQATARYKWVLALRTGDEESLFDTTKVEHPNMKWWIQTPKADEDFAARLIGIGYPPHFRRLPSEPPDKTIPVFLSAQNTHMRRLQCFTALKSVEGRVERTDGFTQGLPPGEYAECMMAAKIAPAPSGAVSPDSFRLYEALEAHTIPIADDISPAYDSAGFFRKLYPDAQFPILVNYSDLPGWAQDLLDDWPANANKITAWWMRQKRRYGQWLAEDLTDLGAL